MLVRKTILIVDDHDLIHMGIAEILHNADDYEVIDHAYDGDEAIRKAAELEPDIILMDISMPKMNGIDATKIILQANPEIKIVALSQHMENEYITRMMQAGSHGYLLKNSKKQEIIRALNDVCDNKKYVNPEVLNKLFTTEQPKTTEDTQLTNRELEILKGIAAGQNNPEIADSLNISVRTVETHRRNLMQKLQVKTVVELLKTASQLNLIDF
jgi:two-component system nitrate/nitrite response regulator NarL